MSDLEREATPSGKRFQRPTLRELELHGAKLGLPEREAQKFYCYYESKGWMVGRSPMKNWRIAMSGWKLRWEESRAHSLANPLKPSAMEMFVRSQELERIRSRMKAIRDSYSEHQSWTPEDLQKFRQLKARKDELLKLLDLTL